jgi:hypothetical protein
MTERSSGKTAHKVSAGKITPAILRKENRTYSSDISAVLV